MQKTAILLGATGLTGRYLLDMLLASDDYGAVKVFTRRSTGKTYAKLEEIVCDLLELDDYVDDFVADEVFCCIGTTKKKTPDKTLYHAIDLGIPVMAARLAAQNKVTTFSVISALGADAKSKVFYSRTKGKMEAAVLHCAIDNVLIYRPSLIFGDRGEGRLAEDLGVGLIKCLPLQAFGMLKKYSAISGEELAKAMLLGATQHRGKQILMRDKFA